MTYMRSWKSYRLTSHTWLGLNPQIGRPLSRIVGTISLFLFYFYLLLYLLKNKKNSVSWFDYHQRDFLLQKKILHFFIKKKCLHCFLQTKQS
jgi:hypothetical protein